MARGHFRNNGTAGLLSRCSSDPRARLGGFSSRRRNSILFGRLAIEFLVVSLGIVAAVMDHAIPVIGRRIDRVQLEWGSAGIDNVVSCPSRNNDPETDHD